MTAKLEGDFVRANRSEVKRSHRLSVRRSAILCAIVFVGLWVALLAATN